MRGPLGSWFDLARLGEGETRSVSAENPTGAVGGGALAAPGDDEHCTDAARKLGADGKVRPCLRGLGPGDRVTLADVDGPGVVQHVWCTTRAELLNTLVLRATYDNEASPAIDAPLGDFFANGIDGLAHVGSLAIAVNPRGGMNSYWPMPFRRRLHLEVENRGRETVPELFYQVTYERRDLPEDVGYLHAAWRRATTSGESPEHVILDGVEGRGHYAGTYLVWRQHAEGWWGEGEVKFFIDGDRPDAPTICGTGTEDYFGGAWGFAADDPDDPAGPGDPRPATYSGPFLGYPQVLLGDRAAGAIGVHGLYRWHLPDPVRFRRGLRVTVQALGWRDDGTYLPLTDDISSVAYWYQSPGD